MQDQMTLALNDSLDRAGQAAVHWLPRVAAMALVLLAAVAVAGVARFAVRRVLERVGFERRVQKWGVLSVSEWAPGRGPSAIVARVVFWFLVVVGFMLALGALDARATDALAARILDYLPNLVVAMAIVFVGIAAARYIERSVLIRAVNLQIQSARLLSLGARWLIQVLAAAMALHHLAIGGIILTISFSILFGGIVLALALAVGLGSRDVVRRSWERQLRERKRRVPEEEEVPHF